MTAHGQNNLPVIRLECGRNADNQPLPGSILFAIIFLERKTLRENSSWEIHGVAVACLLGLSLVTPTGLLSAFTKFLLPHILTFPAPSPSWWFTCFLREDYVDIKSPSTMPQGTCALITLFSDCYPKPHNTNQATKTPPVFWQPLHEGGWVSFRK